VTFLELKPLTAELLPAVIELDRLCFGKLWTLEGYQRELASPNSDLLVLSIPEDTRLPEEFNSSILSSAHPLTCPPAPVLVGLGCLWAILEEAHITILAVHPNYRGQGLGQALLWALLASAHARGLERATLEVRASNLTALSLYQKFGFKTAGRRRHYYQDNDEDALILWRGDLQHPHFPQTLANWNRQVSDRLTSSGWHLNLAHPKVLLDPS
jgi:[ribosomal protein S18]-alanine N-acetyltransferase